MYFIPGHVEISIDSIIDIVRRLQAERGMHKVPFLEDVYWKDVYYWNAPSEGFAVRLAEVLGVHFRK